VTLVILLAGPELIGAPVVHAASEPAYCSEIGGSWGGSTCTFTGSYFANSGTLEISSGTLVLLGCPVGIIYESTGSLVVDAGADVDVEPNLSACGPFAIGIDLDGSGTGIVNHGTINIDPTFGCSGMDTFCFGLLNDGGTVTNYGAISVGAVGPVNCSGGASCYGILNTGTITDVCGGTFTAASGLYIGRAVETGTCTTTSTAVGCSPSSVAVGSSATCTATISGFAGSVTGETVALSQSGGTGAITFSGTCTLSSGGTCSEIGTATAPGTVVVEAAYAGYSGNKASSGNFSLNVQSPAPPAPPTGAEICQHQASGQCFTSFVAFNVTSGGEVVNAEVTITRTRGPTQTGTTEVGTPLQMASFDVSILDTVSYTVTLPNGQTVTGTVSNPNPWTVRIVQIN